MKRIFIIIAITITFLGILISASPFILQLTGLDEPLKKRLLEKVFPDEENAVLELDDFTIGINGISIDQISYISEDGSLELLIDAIEINLDVINLFRHKAGLNNLISRIHIDKPRLILHYRHQEEEGAKPISAGTRIPAEKIEYLLKQTPDILVHSGKVILAGSDGSYFSIAQNLDGALTVEDSLITLSGGVLSSQEKNFNMRAHYNLRDANFRAEVEIKDYVVNNNIAARFSREFTDAFNLHNGRIAGKLKARGQFASLDSLVLNGQLHLEDISGDLSGTAFDSLSCLVNVRNNSLAIDEGRLSFQNTPVSFSAGIKNIFHPVIAGRIYNEAIRIRNIPAFSTLPWDSGYVSLRAQYRFDRELTVKGLVLAPDFLFAGSRFSNLKINWDYAGKQLRLEDLRLNSIFGAFSGRGRYDLPTQALSMELDAKNYSQQHLVFDKLSNAGHDMGLRLNVNFKNGYVNGRWHYALVRTDTLWSTFGAIKGNGKNLKISTRYSSDKDFKFDALVSDYLSDPKISYMDISDFPFHRMTSDPLVHSLRKKIRTTAHLSGTINDLRGALLFRKKNRPDTLFSATTHILNLTGEKHSLKGEISVGQLIGEYSVDISRSFLGSYFNFENTLKGDFFIDLNQPSTLSGNIKLNHFKLYKLAGLKPGDDYKTQAYLDGKVNISGSLKEPRLDGYISGDRFVFNDQGYFKPELKIRVNRTRLAVDTLNIFQNNRPILTGRATWHFLNDQIFGYAGGDNIDLATIFKAMGLSGEVLTGDAAYNFSLKGTSRRPFMQAGINVNNGMLNNIAFDRLTLKVDDRLDSTGTFLNPDAHILEIEDFSLVKSGRYHLYGVGTLPLSANREMDIALKFDGDIFHYLNHWVPFFRDGASFSDINAKLRGRRNDLKLVAADITIDRGELWLADVARHVQDISTHIVLEEGSGKVDIKHFTAFVDNEYLKIHTVRDLPVVDGRKLKHWNFKGLGLDFGILAMETSGEGVNIHLPGLMYANETGHIHLQGRSGQPYFYFAGPIRHPTVFGEVVLNNSQVTFPFVVSGKPGKRKSPVQEFLANMEWDILVRAGKDVSYRRDIPAYIDNVRAELTVDEGSPGLDFTGIIKKGTFRPQGSLVSSRGRLEYLDLNFKVDRFNISFNRNEQMPEVSGRAWTTIRDSVGAIPKTIYLQLYAVDPKTGNERRQGNWEDFKFKLVSADPTIGETQEQVMAYLGYSAENIRQKATTVGGAITERYLIRPLLRPLEKALENNLGIDLVRFNSNIARNLFYSSVGRQVGGNKNSIINPFYSGNSYLYLMSSSEVTLGKYLSENLYLSYTGQLVSVYDNTETGFDFNHSIGLEYRFFRNMLIEFEWDRELMSYYNFANQRQYLEDFKIRFRHSFTF